MSFHYLKTTFGSHLYLTTAFVLWTLTSFACHQCAKHFLHLTGSTTQGVLAVSLIQLTFCYCSTELTNTGKESKTTHQPSSILSKVGHVIATLATNFSLCLIPASSTFAIKMLEPVTSAFIQWLVFGISISKSSVLIIPVIVSGSIMFTGNIFEDTTFSFGIMLAFLSNVSLAFRNIATKKLFASGYVLSIRSYGTVFGIVLISSSLLLLHSLTDRISGVAYGTAATSAVFHVLYSYLSVAMVLDAVSVITHAVLNIFKRVFVVLLLWLFGRREVTLLNIAGLAVSTTGLLLYAVQKGRQKEVEAIEEHSGKRIYRTAWNLAKQTPRKASLFIPICIIILVGIWATGRQQYILTSVVKDCEVLPALPQYILTPNTAPHPLFVNKTLRYGSDVVNVSDFLKWRLVDHPNDTDLLSMELPTPQGVIEEAQRIHANIFGDLFRGFKYGMLFDIPRHENKGDSAISVGEINFIRKMGIQLVYYCYSDSCYKGVPSKALRLSEKYSVENLVLLLHGGGNMFSYLSADDVRTLVLKTFPNHKVIMFPQSIWTRYGRSRTKGYERMYTSHKHLTVTARDKQSMITLRRMLPSTKVILVPDIAFGIGAVPRMQAPSYDILWLHRTDAEKLHYKIPSMPPNVSCRVADWLSWPTYKTTGMELSFRIASNGFLFLQMGRVVITDRLHGHIMSTLLGIPHVLLDNNYRKVGNYHDSWTRSIKNVNIASNSKEALEMAIRLLNMYNETLPKVIQYDTAFN